MLRIGKPHADDMIAHALEEDPNECCGILAGLGDAVQHVYRVTNIAKSPVRYWMDPQEQLNSMLDAERNGWDLLAFFHSHTRGPDHPSQTDVRLALESGWLDVGYVLVVLDSVDAPQIRAFRIDEAGVVTEEVCQIV